MFKKIKCEHCNKMYDEAFNECPKCHAENGNLNSSFKHIQVLSVWKQIALFLMGLAGFEVLGLTVSAILVAAGFKTQDQALANMILNAVVYLILFLSLLAITNKDLKKLLKSFANWKPYVAGAICCGVIIVAGIIYSYILVACGVKIINNDNQQAIDSTSGNYPLTAFVIFGLIGPICEELTYRVGLFSFTKRISKWLAYPLTIAVFALIHFNFSATSITNELINLPYYAIAGFCLAFTYDKYGFAGSTTAHILNNIISLLPMSVMLGAIH